VIAFRHKSHLGAVPAMVMDALSSSFAVCAFHILQRKDIYT